MYKISQQCRCCIGHSYGMVIWQFQIKHVSSDINVKLSHNPSPWDLLGLWLSVTVPTHIMMAQLIPFYISQTACRLCYLGCFSLPAVLAHLPAALQPTSTFSLRSFLILGTKAVTSSQACSVITVSTVATTFFSGVLVLAQPCFIGVCC